MICDDDDDNMEEVNEEGGPDIPIPNPLFSSPPPDVVLVAVVAANTTNAYAKKELAMDKTEQQSACNRSRCAAAEGSSGWVTPRCSLLSLGVGMEGVVGVVPVLLVLLLVVVVDGRVLVVMGRYSVDNDGCHSSYIYTCRDRFGK